MAVKLFNRGYDAVKEEKKRQEKIREEMDSRLYGFFLKDDGDEADIRFLTEEPITFEAHTVKEGKNYNTVICTQENCALCEDDDRPSFMGAYLIIDRRVFEVTNKKTNRKEKRQGQLRLYMPRSRVLSMLDRLSIKNGLTKRDYTIVRLGSGQDTTYTFEPHDVSKITSAEISSYLPEKLREKYDGTQESLYAILQEQLNMLVDTDNSTADAADDEETPPPKKEKRDTLVDVDDEPETEVKPKRPVLKAPPKIRGMFKSAK
jgi:hypothetical protein